MLWGSRNASMDVSPAREEETLIPRQEKTNAMSVIR